MTVSRTKETPASTPEARAMFTVRIPRTLIEHISAYAMVTGQLKQDVIEQAFRCLLTHRKLPPDQARKLKAFLDA